MDRDRVRLRQRPGDYGEKPIRRYELTATLTAGGSAAAKFVQWGTDCDCYEDTSQTFTLYSGAGRQTGNTGDRGWCYYAADSQQWEVIAGGAGATAIGVLLTTLFYGTTIGATVRVYVGTPGLEVPAGTVTMYEWMLEPGDSSAPGTMVALSIVNGYWYIRNASCGSFYGSAS